MQNDNNTRCPAPYVVGIDIGGTNLRIGAVTRDFRLFNCKKASSRSLLDIPNPLDAIKNFIGKYIQEQGPGNCAGICIGFPGTVARDKRHVYSCPNLPALSNIDIAAPLSEAFHVPVIAEHDVILLLANDMLQKNIGHFNTVIALYVGTGLGNALYINGRFLTGKNGASGELGHIPVAHSHVPCPCGNHGCMELYCAGRRLEEIQKIYYPKTSLEDIFRQFLPGGPLGKYLDYLAMAAATEINILDPDCVLLSGGVLNMKDFPMDFFKKRIYHYSRKPYPAENLLFVQGTAHPFSGVMGGGIYMWNSGILPKNIGITENDSYSALLRAPNLCMPGGNVQMEPEGNLT